MADTLTRERVRRELADRLDGADISEGRLQLEIRVPAERRIEALAALKDFGFEQYTFCAAVDWPDEDRIEILDHVYHVRLRQRVTVRCDLPRSNPHVPTAAGVYRGADWHERETWELFGVVFTGHPKLSRLLLPEWFEGFPMRKDFELPARVEKPWPGESFKPE